MEIPPAGSGSYTTTPPIGLALNACGQVTGAIDPYYDIGFSIESTIGFTISPHVFVYTPGTTANSSGTTIDLGVVNPSAICYGYSFPINNHGALANGISASGALAGNLCSTTEAPNPFAYVNGSFTQVLPTPTGFAPTGFVGGTAAGINSSGLVAGTFEIAISIAGCAPYHSFLYNTVTGKFQDLGGIVGPCGSIAQAINDAGKVIGSFNDLAYAPHAYLYDSNTGKGIDLGYLEIAGPYCGYGVQANGLSSNGQVTGYSNGSNCAPEAFLYTQGNATIGVHCYASTPVSPSPYAEICDLGNLGGINGSVGNGVNASGQVTGQSSLPNGAEHAFLYSNGAMQDLNSLISSSDAVLYTLVDGVAINDAGQILVTGYANSNPSQPISFLLTPPAPITVPNVVGATQSAADATIVATGLSVGTTAQQSSMTIITGLVVSQSPSAGAGVAGGSAVNLVVSSGSTCADIQLVKAAFGSKLGQPAYNPIADVNHDGVVNIIDLSTVARAIPAGTVCN